MPINAFTSGGLDLDRTLVRRDFFQEGNMWAWGLNNYGQLGDNTIIHRSSPVQTISGGNNWKEIGKHSEAGIAGLKSDGTLWTWGRGIYGSLGLGDSNHRSSPTLVTTGGSNWKQVSMGINNSAVIDVAGGIWTFGRGDIAGLNGAGGVSAHRFTPLPLATSNTWIQVSVGQSHSAAIKTDGTIWTWGKNYNGELGQNDLTHRTAPAQIATSTIWKYTSAASVFTSAIKTDGTLWTWGFGFYGTLGDNTTIDKSSPIQTVAGGTNWIYVNCDNRAAAAIKTDGTLWTWGKNYSGQLGDNTSIGKSSPIQTIAGGTNWKQVAVGYKHMAAIKTDGTLWTWGRNVNGELGDNTTIDKSSPIQTTMSGTNWKQVNAKGATTIAITYVDP
jgi:alpha-tubulin suppressor-like RCC1 family protein